MGKARPTLAIEQEGTTDKSRCGKHDPSKMTKEGTIRKFFAGKGRLANCARGRHNLCNFRGRHDRNISSKASTIRIFICSGKDTIRRETATWLSRTRTQPWAHVKQHTHRVVIQSCPTRTVASVVSELLTSCPWRTLESSWVYQYLLSKAYVCDRSWFLFRIHNESHISLQHSAMQLLQYSYWEDTSSRMVVLG